MRFASSSMSPSVLRFGTSAVMRSACAWWWIIPCMKSTSASVCAGGSSSRELVRRQRSRRLAGGARLDDVRRGLARRSAPLVRRRQPRAATMQAAQRRRPGPVRSVDPGHTGILVSLNAVRRLEGGAMTRTAARRPHATLVAAARRHRARRVLPTSHAAAQSTTDPRVGLEPGSRQRGRGRERPRAARAPQQARRLLRPGESGQLRLRQLRPRVPGRLARSSATSTASRSTTSPIPANPAHRHRRRLPGRPGRGLGLREPALHVGRGDARPRRLRHATRPSAPRVPGRPDLRHLEPRRARCRWPPCRRAAARTRTRS